MPAHKRGSNALFLPLAVPFVILAAVAVFSVAYPSTFAKPRGPGSAGSLVWGDGIFANSSELRAWLKLHGSSYEAWAKMHPQALKLVSLPRPIHSPGAARRVALAKASIATKPSTPAKKSTVKPSTARGESRALSAGFPPGSGSQASSALGIWLLLAFGLVLGAGATAPRAVLRRIGVASMEREQQLRVGIGTAGLSIIFGTIVATLFG
jgi:hypothetical protein